MASHREFAAGFGPASIDMRRGWLEYLPPGCSDPRATPLWAPVPLGLPAAYVLTAEYDTLRDEGEFYAAQLSRAGNSVTLERVDGAIHGFLQFTAFSSLARRSLANACAALRRLLE